MRSGTPSRTAQYVALTRAVLTDKGIVDDPHAFAMLGPSMKATASALTLPGVRARTDSAFFAGLAARTLFFDREVVRALDDAIPQVVTIGAGYDSRAWRFARPDATFFEVDHPATQQEKRKRAPDGGPTYVPLDLETGSLGDALDRAGFDAARPALFVVEGVTMYLVRADVHDLFAGLAELAAPGSRLTANFAAPPDSGTAANRRTSGTLRILGRLRGEAHKSWLGAAEVAGFVSGADWRVDRVTRLRELALELLASTDLDIDGTNPEAAAVAATRE